MEIIFWLSAGFVVYVYAGFPVLLTILNRLFHRPVRKAPSTPSVSVLVAAYNEARVTEEKIRNSLALDYPEDKLEIVIASDGSADATAELAKKFEDGRRVRVFAYPKNRGKLITLNDTVPRLQGEIVAFSDAASMLQQDALRRLAANFADPEVGAVSGLYRVCKTDEAHIGASEDLYWKYETFLKHQEAGLDSILGCHGAPYAIRHDLYPFPAPGTINDDYVIPMRILERGYRVAYEPTALATEEAHEMGGFSRRVRIMTGNFQQLAEIKYLLRPFRAVPLFFILSHKGGRLAVPLAMIAALISNAFLIADPLYRLIFAGQLAFYALAIIGAVWQLWPKVLRLPYYFSMINAAAFVGIYYATFGRQRLLWRQKSS